MLLNSNMHPPSVLGTPISAKGAKGMDIGQINAHRTDKVIVVAEDYYRGRFGRGRRGGQPMQRGRGRGNVNNQSVNASLVASGPGAPAPPPQVQEAAPVPVPPRPGN